MHRIPASYFSNHCAKEKTRKGRVQRGVSQT